MKMNAHLVQLRKQNPSFIHTDPACEASTSSRPDGKFVIVYLHGLNMDAQECDTVAAACEKSFGDQVINIQPTCREGSSSVFVSINDQAKKVVEEIKTTLRNNYPQYSLRDRNALPINLFGYSQGGVVACTVAANHRDELNIKTIIAAHSPLSGTDVLENTISDVNEFHTKVKPGLKAIGHPNISLFKARTLGFLLNISLRKIVINFLAKGIRDMRIDSPCTANTKAFIREDNHNIPILLIAGYISDLDKYFDFAELTVQVDEFIKSYALFITRQKGGQHDLLIPLKRQLCRADSFENLSTSKDDHVYPSNVKTYVTQGKIHYYNLMPVRSDFEVNHAKTLFESEETIAVITEFITNHIDQYINLSFE